MKNLSSYVDYTYCLVNVPFMNVLLSILYIVVSLLSAYIYKLYVHKHTNDYVFLRFLLKTICNCNLSSMRELYTYVRPTNNILVIFIINKYVTGCVRVKNEIRRIVKK